MLSDNINQNSFSDKNQLVSWDLSVWIWSHQQNYKSISDHIKQLPMYHSLMYLSDQFFWTNFNQLSKKLSFWSFQWIVFFTTTTLQMTLTNGIYTKKQLLLFKKNSAFFSLYLSLFLSLFMWLSFQLFL